jgi:hypothetical protein
MAVLELKEDRVNVFPFSDNYAAIKDVPIATVAMIWEDPKNGKVWMLVFHEALYFGSKVKESLLCPNQMRDAGIKIEDVPIQFDTSSSHSIKVDGTLEIPLEMHGIISYIKKTQLPTDEELDRYHEGLLQSVELTADTPWEPYSKKFAEQEHAARTARHVSAMRETRPCSEPSASNEAKDEDDDSSPFPRRPCNPDKEARCIAVASRWAQSRDAIELADEDALATRLIAAMNITSTDVSGDGLDSRPEDSLFAPSDEDRAIAGMSTKERGPVITKEI